MGVSAVLILGIIAINHEYPLSDQETHNTDEIVIQSEIEPVIKTDLDIFLDELGFKESTNNYKRVNSFGYMGKYQFGIHTLRSLGYTVSKQEFLNSPEIQEQAMLDLLQHNKEYLDYYIKKYDGKYRHGVLITESGILAAAHLAGQGNVRRYLRHGIDFRDGYGTSITYYIKRFGGYDLNLPEEPLPLLVDNTRNDFNEFKQKYETNTTL